MPGKLENSTHGNEKKTLKIKQKANLVRIRLFVCQQHQVVDRCGASRIPAGQRQT